MARFMYRQELNVPELMVKGGRTYRLIKDQLGSVRLVVDTGDGTIVQEMRYDAWGNVTYDSNPGFQPFGFAGGLYDPQTRLVRFGARDYDAQLGRWMGKDPLLFSGGINLFSYAGDSPATVVDENGLCPSLCPRFPPGCGNQPNPHCGCSKEAIVKASANAAQQIQRILSGAAPSGSIGAAVTCSNAYLGDGWYQVIGCDWPPHEFQCSGDPCVDYCACRHEWRHAQGGDVWNIAMDNAAVARAIELPAYDEELRCLVGFAMAFTK